MSEQAKPVSLTIDGKKVTVPAGTSIWRAAQVHLKREIPALCHTHSMGINPVGVCRVCVVDVLNKGKSGGNYAASCMRECEEGMEVETKSEKLEKTRKTLIEILLADHPTPCQKQKESGGCDLERLGLEYGLLTGEKNAAGAVLTPNWANPTFTRRDPRTVKEADKSNFSIAIDHAACILCDRCVRGCDEVENFVIGRSGKGFMSSIGFDADKKMGDSSCVNCGECMIHCPTGAITYSGYEFKHLAVDESRGEKLLTPEEMLAEIPLLKVSKVNMTFLKRSYGGVARRVFNKDDVICRQGEHGRTAYYLNEGTVTVYLEIGEQPGATQKNGGLFGRLFGGKGKTISAKKRDGRSFIPIDAPVDLDRDKPIARLGELALFGEMSCINHQRRSATVRADEDDTVVIEMTRNFLDVLRRNPDFRAKIEEIYRKRSLLTYLRANSVFAEVSDGFLGNLSKVATLRKFRPGEVITKQDDDADAFYIICIGHVKIDEARKDGRTVFRRYLKQSETFGEVGLLLPPHKRVATCTALDEVEVVRIGREEFNETMAMFSGVREELIARAEEIIGKRGPRPPEDTMGAEQLALRETLVKDFVGQQIYMGQSLLVLNLERCTRCDECVKACGDTHNTITRLTRDGLRFDKYLVTTSCRSCHDPKCLVGCPVDAIHRKEGLPIIIEDYCTGCNNCVEQCPFGNITMHHDVEVIDLKTGERREGKRAMVCDLDNCLGEVEEPSCVYACPHNAAERIDGDVLFERVILGQKG